MLVKTPDSANLRTQCVQSNLISREHNPMMSPFNPPYNSVYTFTNFYIHHTNPSKVHRMNPIEFFIVNPSSIPSMRTIMFSEKPDNCSVQITIVYYYFLDLALCRVLIAFQILVESETTKKHFSMCSYVFLSE